MNEKTWISCTFYVIPGSLGHTCVHSGTRRTPDDTGWPGIDAHMSQFWSNNFLYVSGIGTVLRVLAEYLGNVGDILLHSGITVESMNFQEQTCVLALIFTPHPLLILLQNMLST